MSCCCSTPLSLLSCNVGYGGPHAGFIACKDTFVRRLPGRVIGVTKVPFPPPTLRRTLLHSEEDGEREKD